MKKRKYEYYVADFETTVYDGQEATEVWASGVVKMHTEDVVILHSIESTFDYLLSKQTNIICYFHNLKFDGSFWMDFLLIRKGFKQAIIKNSEKEYDISFQPLNEMKNNTFRYSISDMGQWYNIIIKVNNIFIEFRDSLKLLPFSVKKIGESFKTKHKKLDMEYKGFRYAGCPITEEEKKYIANDVLVIKEALEFMFSEQHTNLTIGSCCLEEFRKGYDTAEYKHYFPQLYDIKIDEGLYGTPTAGDYIRKSYKGGWCYCVEGKENKIYTNGTTFDVNSLYPSMMHSKSGNYYPIGEPTFWSGNYIPSEIYENNRYYFIRIRTRFYIKPNKLPCIQIKGNLRYKSTKWLTTSDIYSERNNLYYDSYKDADGFTHPAKVELTLTMTDFALIKEHYDLVDFEILDGCHFATAIGLFDRYINKYAKIKMNSEGAVRELAKLFLNNLYGKFASSPNSSFKYAEIKDNVVVYHTIKEAKKIAGYIAVGSAITSYSRNFTIRSAQSNYHGVNEKGFIYADTDSIHCDLLKDEIQGINIHDYEFCCWKHEGTWDKALFVRQKTYMEHIIETNKGKLDKPKFDIKCAGMPENCKKYFLNSMEQKSEEQWIQENPEYWNKLSKEAKDFILQPRDMQDFTLGLLIPDKLMPKTIIGGVLLKPTTYQMR